MDGIAVDDDNDGVCLLGKLDGESVLRDGVFAEGKDDGVGHNGAAVRVERVIIDGFDHEVVACSSEGSVDVVDSVILGCGQGGEAGYGHPDVHVDHSTLLGNGVALRFGDEYGWETSGHLSISATVAVLSDDDNVLNLVAGLGGPLVGAITITGSMVDDPDWDGRDGNLPGVPELDGWRLLDGADVGVRW